MDNNKKLECKTQILAVGRFFFQDGHYLDLEISFQMQLARRPLEF